MVDFDTTKPYPAYLREHSPGYGTYGAGRAQKSANAVPDFRPASELLREPAPTATTREVAHADAEARAGPDGVNEASPGLRSETKSISVGLYSRL